jgi:hypothetical protein
VLTIKKELDFYDFQNEYENILKDIDYDAQEIIFEALESIFEDGTDDMTVRDYIRFQVCISSSDELLGDYDIMGDEEKSELNDEEIIEKVEDYLNDNTHLLGSYEEDGKTYFIYDEF